MAKAKQSSTTTAVEVGAGLLAAAAAGYYFYGSEDAKKHRAAASKWAKGMKAEVVKEAQKVKKLDKATVAGIVDKAAAAYATVRTVDQKDLNAAAAELKKNWRRIGDELGGLKNRAVTAVKSGASAAKKAAKNQAPKKKPAAKKTAKKAPQKAAKKSVKKAAR